MLTSFNLELGARPPARFVGNFLGIMGGEVDHLRLVCTHLFREFFSEEVIVPIGQITEHYYNIEHLAHLLLYSLPNFQF